MENQEHPIRKSVKLILLNSKNEILLMNIDDKLIKPVNGSAPTSFWHMIGGKIEEGESIETAAYRELFEETGLTYKDVSIGKVVWYGTLSLYLHGILTIIQQQFVLAHTVNDKFTLENLTSWEKRTVKKLKWFTLEELNNSTETIYPVGLYKYLKEIISGNYPEEPLFIELGEK